MNRMDIYFLNQKLFQIVNKYEPLMYFHNYIFPLELAEADSSTNHRFASEKMTEK